MQPLKFKSLNILKFKSCNLSQIMQIMQVVQIMQIMQIMKPFSLKSFPASQSCSMVKAKEGMWVGSVS